MDEHLIERARERGEKKTLGLFGFNEPVFGSGSSNDEQRMQFPFQLLDAVHSVEKACWADLMWKLLKSKCAAFAA